MRQALLAIQITQAVGQIDPGPRLFDSVARQSTVELPLENATGVIGADFSQGTYVNDEMRSRPEAFFHRRDFSTRKQIAKARLGRFDRAFAQLSALEKLDM